MEKVTINTYVILGSLLFTVVGGMGSYFKAISDIRQELSLALYNQTEMLRKEFQANYATKEETRFIKEAIMDIKSDLKEIKSSLVKK